MSTKVTPKPFTITIDDDVLEDLKQRLARIRWPDEIPEAPWKYGSSLSYIKELIEYWQKEYDWRATERKLNSFAQYIVHLDDIDLHYIHVPGVGPNPMPLIISHGWPGSVYEFIKIIGPLTDPARYGGDPKDAFTVVAPSLPGYGFSSLSNRRRMNMEGMAKICARLMTEVLGFARFVAQGGDWGALITTRLGFAYPDQVLGIHVNMIAATPHSSEITNLTAAEGEFIQKVQSIRDETGYQYIQGTKPQTLAYGLNDSPVGLAAWITEKFYTWTDCHGDIESSISKDDLLSNIMIYWVTQTINSSFWLYYQLRHEPWNLQAGERITVPTGFASFPGEIISPPREWVERVYNLKHWTQMKSGGHFAALEEPEALVADIRAFCRDLR